MKKAIKRTHFLYTTGTLIGLLILGSWGCGIDLSSRYWFDDLKAPLTLPDEDLESFARFVSDSVFKKEPFKSALPASIRKDRFPRLIFLSLSDGKRPAILLLASGRGLTKTLDRLIAEVEKIETTRSRFQPEWAKVDIVDEVRDLGEITVDKSLKRKVWPGHGIAFGEATQMAFLPNEVVAYRLIDRSFRPQLNRVPPYRNFKNLNGLEMMPEEGASLNLYRFSTRSFFSDNKELVELYRGHRLFRDLSEAELMQSAVMAGEYLTRAVRENGMFDYLYLPKEDKTANDYNMVRHAGTVYSMMELYGETENEELFQAASRAMDYLLDHTRPCGKQGDLTCIVYGGYTKLGANALAAVAIAKTIEVTQDRELTPVVLKLGKWIQETQDDEGRFTIHKKGYPNGPIVEFTSRYYPGESILALMRIYELTKDESFLESAERAARYLIRVRDQGKTEEDIDHDHWLLYGLNELYRYQPDAVYYDHVLKIVRAIIMKQHRDERLLKDWIGGYKKRPRSTPAATRNEGLSAAYQMVRDAGDTMTAELILEAMELGVAFQLQTQFRPEQAMYFKNPQRCLGGFHSSLFEFGVRNDYVQHSISAILGLYDALRKKPKSEDEVLMR